VLAVAAGPPTTLKLAGLIALSDPPRADSAPLVAELRTLGVQTVMLTGDAAATAAIVASAIGLTGAVCPPGASKDNVRPEQFSVFAGVFPEDKFHIVKAFQKSGHVVGMCGDGANDAPALRQAQMGIAVSTATDVAKSAAGMVLTSPGLGGIVAAVTEGRITFQRILTYTLRSVTRKIDQMLFLTVGLAMTGHAILTPLLMVILMSTGDFLAMSSTTDNVRASQKPNAWRIDSLTIAGGVLGMCNLVFCSSILAVGKFKLGLDMKTLQTLAAVTLVFSGQSVFYVVRDRKRIWSSRPGRWVVMSSAADVLIIGTLAHQGLFMAALSLPTIAGIAAAAILFAFLLDTVKVAVFTRLQMAAL
jgi:H+-transporting ATPase